MSGHIRQSASGAEGRDASARHGRADAQADGRAHQGGRRRAAPEPAARPRLAGRLARATPLALAMAVGAAVAAFAAPSDNAPAAADPPAVTCTLVLPAQPLTAQGLATPFRLRGVDGTKCHEDDSGTAAFAQGLIIDPATGKLSVYDPLVIDDGTEPAAAPVVPALPANAVVALWFGFNGDVLTLSGDGVQAGNCVGGLDHSPFGQFSYCNAPALFTAAHTAISQGRLTVPPVGTAADGKPCPTTRDFGIVDQDQSDNVTTTYLALSDGSTAQNTKAANKKLAGRSPTVLANGSDNLLLDDFVDPALGCTPWTAPDLANGGFAATSLGLNELQAEADQGTPIAYIPVNDPMVLDNDGTTSDEKTNLYRAGVDMPPLAQIPGSGERYCAQLRTIGVTRTKADRSLTDSTVSPDTGAASNLFTFLAQRLQQSYENLGCGQLLKMPNPVHVTLDSNGLAVDATFDKVTTGATPTPSPSASSKPATSAPATSAAPSSSAPASPSAPAGGGATSSPVKSSPTPAKSSAPPVKTSTAPASPTTKPTHAEPPPTTASTPASGRTKYAAPTHSAAAQPSTPAAQHSTLAAGSGSGSGGSAGGDDSSADDPNGGSGAGNAVAPNASAQAGNPAGAGTGAVNAAPAAATTSTPISIAGFEHADARTTGNPLSALSGPDPMAHSGFSIMHSRLFWALAGALIVLCASLTYQRRPKQRKQSRRGVSS